MVVQSRQAVVRAAEFFGASLVMMRGTVCLEFWWCCASAEAAVSWRDVLACAPATMPGLGNLLVKQAEELPKKNAPAELKQVEQQ